jgi:hypothetical protein
MSDGRDKLSLLDLDSHVLENTNLAVTGWIWKVLTHMVDL